MRNLVNFCVTLLGVYTFIALLTWFMLGFSVPFSTCFTYEPVIIISMIAGILAGISVTLKSKG